MVDTNSDPRPIDYLIPSNDDASKSIDAILSHVSNAIIEGLAERKSEKTEKDEPKAAAPKKAVKADDLTKIEGIGPKIAEVFNEQGIMTFADLAFKTEDDLKEILVEAGSTFASNNPASWAKQAKMAAEGKWDELKEWQDTVKGGVE
jgi:small subunit ribosomal protein S2